jgi:hypothetical protein
MRAAIARRSPVLDASDADPDTQTALDVLSASFPGLRGNKRRWGGRVNVGAAQQQQPSPRCACTLLRTRHM